MFQSLRRLEEIGIRLVGCCRLSHPSRALPPNVTRVLDLVLYPRLPPISSCSTLLPAGTVQRPTRARMKSRSYPTRRDPHHQGPTNAAGGPNGLAAVVAPNPHILYFRLRRARRTLFKTTPREWGIPVLHVRIARELYLDRPHLLIDPNLHPCLNLHNPSRVVPICGDTTVFPRVRPLLLSLARQNRFRVPVRSLSLVVERLRLRCLHGALLYVVRLPEHSIPLPLPNRETGLLVSSGWNACFSLGRLVRCAKR